MVEASPERTALLMSRRFSGVSGSSEQRTAARAWAIGREANHVNKAFSLRPDPAGVPTATSTSGQGNQVSIMRAVMSTTVPRSAGYAANTASSAPAFVTSVLRSCA